VPLSLICKSPDVAPNSVCKILVIGNDGTRSDLGAFSGLAVNDNASLQLQTSVVSDAAVASNTEDYSQLVSGTSYVCPIDSR
jgi:hypothetical protein